MTQPKLRIREIRRAKGLTSTQLAEMLSTTQASVSRFEQGRQSLSVEWLVKIAAALGVEPSALIESDGTVAFVRGDLRPGRPDYHPFKCDAVYGIPVPAFRSEKLDGKIVDAFRMGDRELVFGLEAQSSGDLIEGRLHILQNALPEHIDASVPDLSAGLLTQTKQIGPHFLFTHGWEAGRRMEVGDPMIQKVWVVHAEYREL